MITIFSEINRILNSEQNIIYFRDNQFLIIFNQT